MATSHTFNRLLTGVSFAEADARIRKSLGDSGFGILTEIDVAATMKEKLYVEMTPCLILGTCNPKTAYQAIGIEPLVGAMLPCKLILRAVDGDVEVSAIGSGGLDAGDPQSGPARRGGTGA